MSGPWCSVSGVTHPIRLGATTEVVNAASQLSGGDGRNTAALLLAAYHEACAQIVNEEQPSGRQIPAMEQFMKVGVQQCERQRVHWEQSRRQSQPESIVRLGQLHAASTAQALATSVRRAFDMNSLTRPPDNDGPDDGADGEDDDRLEAMTFPEIRD